MVLGKEFMKVQKLQKPLFINVQMDVQTELVFKMKNKRGSAWIWILVVLIVIAVGVGAYFLLSGDGGSIVGGGSSIPSPPALPN